MYLVWFDPDKRRSIRTKLDDAIAVYHEKFADDPAVCLVNAKDRDALLAVSSTPPILLRSERFVPPNTFYVGHDEPIVSDDQANEAA